MRKDAYSLPHRLGFAQLCIHMFMDPQSRGAIQWWCHPMRQQGAELQLLHHADTGLQAALLMPELPSILVFLCSVGCTRLLHWLLQLQYLDGSV